MNEVKPEVGQKIFVVETGNEARTSISQGLEPKTFEGVVAKVGRKYFYVDVDWRKSIKVRIKGWVQGDSVWNSNLAFYNEEKTYRDEVLRNKLYREIKYDCFDGYRYKDITLDQLKQIATVLNIEYD